MNSFTYMIFLIELIAFFLLGTAFLFQRILVQPVERIRLLQGTLIAITVTVALVFLPVVPRTNLGLLPQADVVPTSAEPQQNSAPTPIAESAETVVTPSPETLRIPARSIEIPISSSNAEMTPKPVVISRTRSPWSILNTAVPLVFGAALLYYAAFWWIGVIRLRRILKTATVATDPLLPNGVRLLVSPKIDTPFVYLSLRGFFKPVIVMPCNLSNASRRFALAHELSHISHRDLWFWQVLNLLTPLFWMQPFYAILCRQLRLDQDFLADQAASQVAAMPEDYASVLLSFARLRKPSPLPATLNMGDRPTFLHRRIEMILQNDRLPLRTRPRRFMMCVLAGLLGTMVLILGTVRLTAQDTPKPTDDSGAFEEIDTLADAPEKLVELVFTALDPDGKPVPDTLVGLWYSDWHHPVKKIWTTDSDGCVKSKIPVKIIDNQGRFEAYNRDRQLLGRAEFPFEKSGLSDPVHVRCILQKTRRITGTVLDANDQPVENANVSGTDWGALRIACAKTDKQGKFEYDASSEIPIGSIFAMKPGVGYDEVTFIENAYDYFQKVNDKNWKNEKHDNGPFTLKLKKGETITVRVVNDDHRPLEGIMVSPGFSQVDNLGTLLGQKTDAEGIVVFDWIPGRAGFTACGANPRFERSGDAGNYGHHLKWSQGLPNETLEITLPRRVEVRGSVRLEDGTPVPWCRLEILTGDMMTVGESTGHDGNFSYDVNERADITILPDGYDQPLVAAKKWMERVVLPDDPETLPRFDFVLIEGTKLSGRILSPTDQKPIPDAYLWVSELKGTGELMPRKGFSERHIRADAGGNYSVALPPGIYRAENQDKSIAKTFEIKNEKELSLDF